MRTFISCWTGLEAGTKVTSGLTIDAYLLNTVHLGNVATEDILEIWHNNTFDIKEVLQRVSFSCSGPGDPDCLSVHVERPGIIESLDLTIEELSMEYGRCYVVKSSRMMRPADAFMFFFNLSLVKEQTLFFHEEHNEIGLNMGFWPVMPPSHLLEPGDVVNLGLQKQLHLKHKGKHDDCSKDSEYSYPKCVADWAKSQFRSLWKDNPKGKETLNLM